MNTRKRDQLARFEAVFNEAVSILNSWSGSERLFEPITSRVSLPEEVTR